MAVVCSTSYHQSARMSEHLARALAARTELFGYQPYVTPNRAGGYTLALASDSDDLIVAQAMAEWPDDTAPVAARADGSLLMLKDTVRLPDGRQGRVFDLSNAGIDIGLLIEGSHGVEGYSIDAIGGRWVSPK